MKKFVFGNWKMNMTLLETENYLKQFSGFEIPENVSVGIAFPYTNLANANKYNKSLSIGAQNVHYEEGGAYTGEISSIMLKSLNVNFCLVGHSERRKIFGETNKFINKKIKSLLKYNIKAVLCVGEKESENIGCLVVSNSL